jgi:hypothetical protein
MVFFGVLRLLLLVVAVLPATVAQADQDTVQIAWLSHVIKRSWPLSYLDQPPLDEGVEGARLGIADNETTGRFTGQSFALLEAVVPPDEDVTARFREIAAKGVRLVVTDLAAPELLSVAGLPEAGSTIFFNTAAPEDKLRGEDCRANLLHLLPSRAMLADALVQYLVVKRWRDILLVVGHGEGDREFAVDIRHAALKFQARIVEEKPWAFVPGARRTDTGHFAVEAEVARFTQGIHYDVLVVADEADFRPPPGRRDPRTGCHSLGPAARAMGRDPAAEPLPAAGQALDDRPRLRRMDGGEGYRRGRGAREIVRSGGNRQVYSH